MTGYAIYFDSSKCTGCKGCQVACKCWNQLPSPLGLNANEFTHSYQSPMDLNGDTRLIMAFEENDNGKKWGVNWSIGRRSCMHCIDPACVSVCPANALRVDEETGFVSVHEENCIGCQYCSSACPFDVPRYYGDQGKINKCTACLDRIKNGKEPSINGGTDKTQRQFDVPACVHTCPPGALEYGPRDEMLAKAHERVAFLQAREFGGFPDAMVYGEKELSGTHVIMVLKFAPETYGLPADPKVSEMVGLVDIMKPLTAVAAGATIAGLGLSFLTGIGYKRHKMCYDEKNKDVIDVETGEIIKHIDDEEGKE